MYGIGSILKDYLEYYRITQSDFAERLGISQKHMNEIINGNTNISPELMISISLLTEIDLNLIVYAEQLKGMHNYLYNRFKTTKKINDFLNGFYINEMNKKKWLTLRDKENPIQNGLDLLNFMKVKDFDLYAKYSNNKILYKKCDDANQIKVFLWLTHCDNLSKNIKVGEYNSSNLDKLFNELKIESNKPFKKDSIISILNKYGIILVIEDALSGTKVRGASKVMGKTPVIYLTTYYKEKSSFYFSLYHELAHIKRDYNKLISKTYVDDDVEVESDTFALNKMIPDEIWNEILQNKEDIDNISNKYSIPKCFIYSRLAYEGIISYKSKTYNLNIEKINL